MAASYTTREDVQRALDHAETARPAWQIDAAIEAGARTLEGDLHRVFYPQVGTRTFDWPNYQYAAPWRLWLDENDLISVTSLVVAGDTIASGDYLLRPDTGPPFTHVEINLAGQASFGSGDSHQRSISIAGLWGHSNDETPAGELAEALDATETGVDVSDSNLVGIGSILRADNERMIVTGKSLLDTGQDLTGDMDASTADTTLAVASGAALHAGEEVVVDAERMLITDIAGNNAIVKRAVDGSVLAAHLTGASVFAPRTLTVERGALGTTAATHSTAAPLVVHVPPGPIATLNRALAIAQVEQEQSGYARTVGTGDNQREARGTALAAARMDAITRYGRKARKAAV